MARPKNKQKRIGKIENKLVNALKRRIKKYNIFYSQKKNKETQFNSEMIVYLKQRPNPINISNKGITPTNIAGEEFRPEFYLSRNNSKICAVECKRLIDKTAKSKWKEGLSQALLYSAVYKFVILVYYDFTKNSKYFQAFGQGNNLANQFAKKLLKKNSIAIIVLKPIREDKA